MSSSEERLSREKEESLFFGKRDVSRREFLRVAGMAGATLGLGAGLGGLIAACGSAEEITTTTSTTAPAQSSTTAASATSTTVTSAAETGREIKIGFVTPQTGSHALFGLPDKYCADRWNEALEGGLVCGDGKKHPVSILVRDSQSDTNRAAQVAGDLITNDKVDVIMAASTNETVSPVAVQAEALGCPMFSNDAPWQAYYFGRGATPDKPFKWTWHHFWGLDDLIATYVDMWNSLQTNKKVALLSPNDTDGNAVADAKLGLPPGLIAGGYTVVDSGRYPDGTEDFTSQISQFKNAGCEIITGAPVPPDWTSFWQQSVQQGFKPVAATVARALLFPGALEALGSIGYGMSTEVWWTPMYPFVSSFTGETCQQLADDFEKRTGQQWTQPLLHYGVFEVVADALKRTKNVDDKEAVVTAISTTKMETLGGPIDFTAPVDMNSLHPVKNVYRTPLVGGQWIKGATRPFDLAIVNNSMAPQISTTATLAPIQYT